MHRAVIMVLNFNIPPTSFFLSYLFGEEEVTEQWVLCTMGGGPRLRSKSPRGCGVEGAE